MFEKEAEEYAHTKHCKKCSSHCEKKCILVKDDYETFKQGAEFGYNKANEWHDLRKNPNDLPPKMISNPNFSIDVLSDIGEIVCFNFTANEWFYWRHKKPIAWREIPKFKENE